MPDGPFPNFRSFHEFLDKHDELRRVSASVDPVLELAEVADRVMKSPAPTPHNELDKHVHADKGGRALIFDNVQGSDIPVAINTFGSYWRITRALGTVSLEDLAARIARFVKPVPPPTLMGKMKFAAEAAGDLKGLLPSFSKFVPSVLRGGAPCQEVVWTGDKIDLDKLPIIQCWPHDGDIESGQVFGHLKDEVEKRKGEVRTGKYITLAGIYTKDPDDGTPNVGMYRVQKFDKKTCAMHWHMHHDGARHYRGYAKRGERTPLAIVLGGPSVMPYSATAPLPPGIPELLFAGFVNRSPIEMVKCKTIDMNVPAEAEIVIEGHVHPTDKLLEGPFGDHTGFYSLADMYPKFEVSCITMRREPVYPTTIVGKPPMEDYFLGKATERVFLPLLKTLIPDILDYSLPMAGVFHNCAYVKIKKEYPQQARRVMHAIWGAGQMAFTKFIIVVDEHVDVHNEQDVLFHLFANVDPKRDVEMATGVLDILDHASPKLGIGSKIGFDATEKWEGEGYHADVRKWPLELAMDTATRKQVDERWAEFGL